MPYDAVNMADWQISEAAEKNMPTVDEWQEKLGLETEDVAGPAVMQVLLPRHELHDFAGLVADLPGPETRSAADLGGPRGRLR